MANQYDIKTAGVKRRRGLVDALTEQSMTPTKGQMVGQVYVGPGLLDALSKPLLALGAGYVGDQLDKEELQNSQDRQSALVNALSGMQPGTSEFINQGLGSEFPELQAAGMKGLEAQLAPTSQERFLAPVMTADGRLVQPSNRGRTQDTGYKGYTKPEREIKIEENADGTKSYVSIDPATGEKTPIEGNAYVRPPNVSNINMPPLEKARDKEVGTGEGKTITSAREQRIGAQRMFMMANRLESLDKDGILSGPTAKPITFAAQFASGLGVQLAPETQKLIANTENFDVTIGKEISNMVLNSAAGRGFTDTDRDYVVRSFPGLMQTPAGRKEAIRFLKEASVRGSKEGKMIEDAIKEGNYDKIDLTGGQMDQFSGRKPTRSGTDAQGRKVVQFSDGSIEYAN